MAKLFSPSLEAARLISATSIILVSLMTASIVRDAWGRPYGVLAFMIMGFSHFWYYWNIQVTHFPISNLCLVAGLWLILRGPGHWGFSLAAGFVAGWMAASRLILGPVVFVLFYLIIREAAAACGGWRPACRIAVPFILGGLVAGLPMFALFIADFDAAMFDFVGARWAAESIQRWQAASLSERIENFLSLRAESLLGLFWWIDGTPKATFGNLILFVPLISALPKMAAAGFSASAKAMGRHRTITAAAWMVFGVLGIHFATVVSGPQYIQGIIPFLVIIFVGMWAQVQPSSGPGRWTTAAVALALIPYAAYQVYFVTSGVIRRNEPSDGRIITAARVSCWLERNTALDEIVMNQGAMPVALSGRRLPHGFEYNNGIAWMFWGRHLDEAMARRYHIFRAEDFEALLDGGRLRVLVDDSHLDTELTSYAPRVRPLIAENYRLLWTTGGPWPYRIYIRNENWRDDLPTVAPIPEGRVTLAKRAGADPRQLLSALAADTVESLRRLPSDLGDSWVRLTNAPLERRCGDIGLSQAR